MSGRRGSGPKKTLTGYFYSAWDARRAHNNLRVEFATLQVKPHQTPTGLGPQWCVEVVVPPTGPYLHGPLALESFEDLVLRAHGTMDPAPPVWLIATRGDATYLLDVGHGMGQIVNIRTGVLDGPRRLVAVEAHGCWEDCPGLTTTEVLATARRAAARGPQPLPGEPPQPGGWPTGTEGRAET